MLPINTQNDFVQSLDSLTCLWKSGEKFRIADLGNSVLVFIFIPDKLWYYSFRLIQLSTPVLSHAEYATDQENFRLLLNKFYLLCCPFVSFIYCCCGARGCMNTLLFFWYTIKLLSYNFWLYAFLFYSCSKDFSILFFKFSFCVTSRTVNQCKLDSLSAKQRMLKLY